MNKEKWWFWPLFLFCIAIVIVFTEVLARSEAREQNQQWLYLGCFTHHKLDECDTFKPKIPSETIYRMCIERFTPQECNAKGLQP